MAGTPDTFIATNFNSMNKNKVIALIITLAVYFGPFGALFFYNDVLLDTFAEMSMFLLWMAGMIIAFYISVNEPFGRRKTAQQNAQHAAGLRKAA